MERRILVPTAEQVSEAQRREYVAHEAEEEALRKREAEKYAQQIERLKLYAMIPASVYRFVRVCEVLKDCFQLACRGDVDSDVVNYRWFRVGLELLKANPHETLQGDAYFNFSDEEQGLMAAALKPFFSYLIKWAKKMLPRHEDPHYVDELEITVDSAIITPMGPQPFDTPAQTEWDFIFERDENIGAVEYTGTVFNGLLRHSKAPQWKSPCADAKVAALSLSDELKEEFDRAMQFSRPEYLAARGRFEAMYKQVKQNRKAAQTLQTGNEPNWDALLEEFRACGAGQEWYVLPIKSKFELLRVQLRRFTELRQEGIAVALRPPEPEPPKKDTLHVVGDKLIDRIAKATVSADYRWVEITLLMNSLESIIRECLRMKQWGVFGNPLYIKTVIAIQAHSGYSCEKGTEDQAIEGAWKALSNMLRLYFRSFAQTVKCQRLPDVESWIKKNPAITYDVDDTSSAPEASSCRGLSASVCGGLFDVSQAIADECYGDDSGQIANMYADVFPADVKWYSFPRVQDKAVPIVDRYAPIEEAMKEQWFKAPSMDCFQSTCRVLVRGLAIANQCGDSKLPSRAWLRTGLQILAMNPQGRLTYKDQHLQYYNERDRDWIMNAFEPVALSLREWAASMMPHGDPDMTVEEAEYGSGIPLADKVDAIMQSVYRLDEGEDRWTLHTFELVFERTDDFNFYRYKTTTFDQMVNALPPDDGEAELIPVKNRQSVARVVERSGCLANDPSGVPDSSRKTSDSDSCANTVVPTEVVNADRSMSSPDDAQMRACAVDEQKIFCDRIEPGTYAKKILDLKRCRLPTGESSFWEDQGDFPIGVVAIMGVTKPFEIPLTSTQCWQVIKALIETNDDTDGLVHLDEDWRAKFKRTFSNEHSNLDPWSFSRYVWSYSGRGRKARNAGLQSKGLYHLLKTRMPDKKNKV